MSRDSLVIHEQTAARLEWLRADPPHATLLLGAAGIGKGSIARLVVSDILGIKNAKLTDSAQVTVIEPDEKQTISIESIRKLQQFLRLKTAGNARIRRAIIIEHAGSMTTEAQNAFLKILEEPPEDTIILMTAESTHDMLPTIRSRAQQLTLQVPFKEAVLAHFADQPEKAVMQAYFLGGGLPGLMTALLDTDAEHPLFASVTAAKTALQQDAFGRLAQIEQIAKQKPDALRFCQALERIAQSGLEHAASKTDDKALKQWTRILRAAHQSRDMLASNVNTKLTLTHLMLQL